MKALGVEIEDGKLVFAEDVRLWLGVDAAPDIVEGPLQVLADIRVELALGVACKVKSTLIGQNADAVDVGFSRVVTHGAVALMW